MGNIGNWLITNSRFYTNFGPKKVVFFNFGAMFSEFSKGPFFEGSITTLGPLFGFPYDYRFDTSVDPKGTPGDPNVHNIFPEKYSSFFVAEKTNFGHAKTCLKMV